MGRKRIARSGLPRWLYLRRKSYYFRPPGPPRKWIPLGPNLAVALTEYAKLIAEDEPTHTDSTSTWPISGRNTFDDAVEMYQRFVLPGKAVRTRKDNEKQFKYLALVFSGVALADIRPEHVKKYLDHRGQSSKVQANREKALLSHLLNCARERGMLDSANPCEGVKGFRENARTVYIADSEFSALRNCADDPLKDALDLALSLGLRPSDILRIQLGDINNAELVVTTAKTKNTTKVVLRFEVTKSLSILLERIQNRPYRKKAATTLLQTQRGEPLTSAALRTRFEKARLLSGVKFQFRDIRAKHATDSSDAETARKRLGHSSVAMTEKYIRSRSGERVAPLQIESDDD
jgi:integrase